MRNLKEKLYTNSSKQIWNKVKDKLDRKVYNTVWLRLSPPISRRVHSQYTSVVISYINEDDIID